MHGPYGRWACLLAAPIALAGCLRHTATVTSAPPPADAVATGGAIGQQVVAAPPAAVRSGPLPQDVPALAWRRDGEGRIWRAGGQAATPLPWWQRFPCDFAADLAPVWITAAAAVHLQPQPLRPRDPMHLAERARAAGYDLGTAR